MAHLILFGQTSIDIRSKIANAALLNIELYYQSLFTFILFYKQCNWQNKNNSELQEKHISTRSFLFPTLTPQGISPYPLS
jgi:hypothetical protein